jgi:ribonuclease P protein component
VRKRAEFELIYQSGFKRSGRLMTLFTREREDGVARLGIAATRKMGGAVERNRAKRIVREVFRHHKPTGAIDVVVIPRRELLDAPYERVEAEFRSLLSRSPKRVNA